MSDAYVVEVFGRTAGIVVCEPQAEAFHFYAATQAFSALEGREFREPYAAAHAARQILAQPRRPTRRKPKAS
jgi:hypothetical protein